MTQRQLVFPGLLESRDDSVEWIWSDDEETSDMSDFTHITVMKDEAVHVLSPTEGSLYVDATVGGGGHTEAIFSLAPTARVIAVDRDLSALAAAERRLANYAAQVTFVHAPFSRLGEELARRGIERVHGLIADLGVSSPQIDSPERGMSFRHEGPLDMRMDASCGETLQDLIRRVSDEQLADIIYRFGDERRSRRIARSIKRALFERKLDTTLDLRRAIIRAVGPVRVGGVDPATRTFQALRIAVNREMDELESLLAVLPSILIEGGVASILSFHSLEDRLVKERFREKELFAPVWKKPLTPSEAESEENPRARSAKLRAAIFRGTCA